MVVTTLERKTVRRNRTKKSPVNKSPWPGTILEAYERSTGPYNIENASTLLVEENLELYNGWPVWQEMTDLEERRFAGIIQEILSLAGRAARLGQAYPDQVECLLSNGDTIKPDVCLISEQRIEELHTPSTLVPGLKGVCNSPLPKLIFISSVAKATSILFEGYVAFYQKSCVAKAALSLVA